jgi:hypothetical protein
MASFYEFLRGTGDAIQRNIGDPYAKALTRAIRTDNYNPFDIIANAEINRRASNIEARNEARTRAREDYFDRLPENRGNIRAGSYRYQDANGNWYSDQVTGEELDEYYKTKRPKERTDEKDEDELEEGQDGSTTPVEQKDIEETKAPAYNLDEMAGEFILGAWGNGQDRIDNMINAGYSLDDYNKIQQHVNDAYDSGRDIHEWTNNAAHKLGYW